ncbi:DUF1702 family protein [Streptomyces sp. NBC_01754]|uniref:DUF1702 family protein n=1 Tax=Streptomyces sp. NBC_01754 TaxID=2975930 RepID=UPI002DDA60CC|nr:DUF1702 family protein [Streptomyces sp. NBC_01754]WSC90965.1 DUF1702 family protein [Streptomyces sp. NBC_01754]WSC96541.1 DUF1702 family protein [Streptomyces sp. NBC_01754]
MASATGSLRRLLMAPSLREVSFAGRGFPVVESAVTRRLEAIPQTVVTGFEWGIESRSLWETERRLSLVDLELQGFAYEGATMASVIRDVMPGRGGRTAELLQGAGRRHIFLNYIGIGFAMAKLPRPLWKKVMPELEGEDFYPPMSWLAVDGYGFDRAYFDPGRWVTGRRLDTPYPWDGHPDYFQRAVDQGIGRALWFIHGARVEDVCGAVRGFASGRRPDLWAGVGLAATFAGCSTGAELAVLPERAGELRGHLAQGAVFAAKARHFSGTVPGHTRAALHALAGITAEAAAVLADDAAPPAGAADGVPAYEIWRRGVRGKLSVNAL